jgi:hypothetical protein
MEGMKFRNVKSTYYLVESTSIIMSRTCAPESGLGCSNYVPMALIDREANFLPSDRRSDVGFADPFSLFNDNFTFKIHR